MQSKETKIMSNPARKMTNKILEAIEQGLLSEKQVLSACLNYMSESDVDCMCSDNCFFEDEDEEDDRFNYSYDDDEDLEDEEDEEDDDRFNCSYSEMVDGIIDYQ